MVRVSSIRRRAHEAKSRIKEAAKERVDEMGLFGKLFNRGQREEPKTAEDAIHQLKETEELLVKKQEYFEKKIEEEVETAKKYGQKNKKMALNALRRKKHHEAELQRIDGTLSKLEAQRAALEDAGTNTEVIRVLAEANKSLKKANMDLDIDKVHDLMDDIGEQMADAEEFNTAIGRPIGDVVDEDDLLDELKELQENAASEKAVEAKDTVPALPEVPAGPLTRSRAPKITKQDTMAELEAWAAAN